MAHFFLIGFMGSGKTSVGIALAQCVRLPFYDLDDLIEKETGKSVSQVFDEGGEAAFRTIESRVLQNCAQLPDGVIACGGGTPCFNNNMEVINRGNSIYLYLNPYELAKRLLGEKEKRPLVAGFFNFDDLYAYVYQACVARSGYYLQAKRHLNTSGKSVAEIIDVLSRGQR